MVVQANIFLLTKHMQVSAHEKYQSRENPLKNLLSRENLLLPLVRTFERYKVLNFCVSQ